MSDMRNGTSEVSGARTSDRNAARQIQFRHRVFDAGHFERVESESRRLVFHEHASRAEGDVAQRRRLASVEEARNSVVFIAREHAAILRAAPTIQKHRIMI